MLVLYETPAGFALFKLLDDGKLANPDSLYKSFQTADAANGTVKLQAFHKFENTVDALSAVTALVEAKVPSSLQTFLTEAVSEKEWKKQKLVVADPKLGSALAQALNLNIVSDASVLELYRGIRSQLEAVLTGLSGNDIAAMSLGLSHSLSRYKLKFSPDKVDTMVVQAIGLLDDLDKELNIYAMRVKEWYGWHFPEMAKVLNDNLVYARAVKLMGVRSNAANTDFSSVLPEELELELKDAAEISMGTEISDQDILNIRFLCDQVIDLSDYRTQLYEYLKHRMLAIAPNLTTLVGELVGARLIAHVGSLMNLAKSPGSTIQVIGAEKALFRALKTKQNTPKYGLIFHASLLGQTGPKDKGKIARMLSAKVARAVRVDALGNDDTPEVGLESRAQVEARIRQLESKFAAGAARKGRQNFAKTPKKYEYNASARYNDTNDSTLPKAPLPQTPHKSTDDSASSSSTPAAPSTGKKRKLEENQEDDAEATPSKKKKEKKEKKDKKDKKKQKKSKD
ncbi:Nucleolar protein 58 [Dimargaris verticillata]|uniref:Nucleolar protein 58 n=1 Tax=Dimargaris verticillata TaxID=2761393 RepID=A0A9W8AZW6_9FUNG|nr:Nucleolar protein 58 [Dimargaris verticillata]